MALMVPPPLEAQSSVVFQMLPLPPELTKPHTTPCVGGSSAATPKRGYGSHGTKRW